MDGFVLYDFECPDGSVDGNVFAYSNQFEGQRSLIVYHNRYAETAGRIRLSVAVPEPGGSEAVRHGLSTGLGLSSQPDSFVIFRDAIAGLEYIRPCRDLSDRGLELQLRAYELHVFIDFREVVDDETGRCRTVAQRLAGRGVESVADEVAELELASILGPLRELVTADRLRRLMDVRQGGPGQRDRAPQLDEIEPLVAEFLDAVRAHAGGRVRGAATARAVRSELETAFDLVAGQRSAVQRGAGVSAIDDALTSTVPGDGPVEWAALLGWILIHRVGALLGEQEATAAPRGWFDEWRLHRPLASAFAGSGLDAAEVKRGLALVRVLLTCERWYVAEEGLDPLNRFLDAALADSNVRAFLGVNEHRGVVWFRSEALDELLGWLAVIAAVETAGDPEVAALVASLARRLKVAKARSDFRVADLLAAVRTSAESPENP